MQLIKTEKYGTLNNDFEIHTYRDNNGDRLIIEPVEITGGKRKDLDGLNSYVPMEGNILLEPHEYEEYEAKLAEVKSSLIIYVNQSLP